jgi:hypothetical protein
MRETDMYRKGIWQGSVNDIVDYISKGDMNNTWSEGDMNSKK